MSHDLVTEGKIAKAPDRCISQPPYAGDNKKKSQNTHDLHWINPDSFSILQFCLCEYPVSTLAQEIQDFP